MECLICGAPATENPAHGDFREIQCSSGCGLFRISGDLSAKMRGRIFDVAPTRIALERMPRKGDIPLLGLLDEELLYVPGTVPPGVRYSS
ncbi:hypothetical protein PS943_05854 [Pseudomonas fluorescens]|jgi:hypothetical protein|uniref:Uncharacterized protein n=1 Tax=Pseudomonas fluorescens TaxID=294 RepID=A0A5E7WU35_PSEFL|nr:hypothetical protein PS943_05854 [Pseudomonas fluorescens]